MDNFWLWVVISLVMGIISAFVFTSAVDKTAEATDEPMSTVSNVALNVVVFSILSFLVMWLVMAILQRGIYAG